MPAEIDVARIICRGGLNTNEDVLFISDNFPGQATALINYEVSQFGGYRRIDGHKPLDTAAPSLPGTGATLGVAIVNDQYYGMRQNTGSATYGVYVRSTGSWGTPLNTSDTRSTVGVRRVRAEEQDFGGSRVLVCTDGVNMPGKISGGLWSVIATTGSSAVSGAAYCTTFQGHTFYAGMPDRDNIIVCTAPATNDDFDAANGAKEFNAGFPIQGIKPWRNALYVFGKKRIRKLSGRTASDFVMDDVTSQLGCVSPDSIIELQGDLIYLSQDGYRTIAGTDKQGDVDLETISEDIKSLLIDLPAANDMADIVSVPITRKSQFRTFLYDSDVSASDAKGFIGGVRYGGGNKQWEFGQLLGIQVNTAYTDLVNGVETTLLGDANGNVHIAETGTSFAGSEIISIYTTPYWDMGNAETQKDFLRSQLFLRSEGSSAALFLGMSLDWGDPDRTQISDVAATLAARTATWDDPLILWDAEGLIWDAAGRPTVNFTIGGNGYSGSYTLFHSSATESPFSVQGWSVRYQSKGVQ